MEQVVLYKIMQEAQLPLRELVVSFVLSSRHSATHGNLAFLCLVVGFVANLRGNGCTRVCKESSHSIV